MIVFVVQFLIIPPKKHSIEIGARNKSLPKSERERYKKEEKARKNRNKQKSREERKMISIEKYVIGLLIFLGCMGIFYLFFTKILSFSRVMWDSKQQKDYSEEMFVIDKKYLSGILISGIVVLFFLQSICKLSYEYVLFFSVTWGFFWFQLNIRMNKEKEKRKQKTISSSLSKEEWERNFIDKVPIRPFAEEDFSNLDEIRRNVGDGNHYYRDQCDGNSPEFNVYRIDVLDNNIIALKIRCMAETGEKGVEISYKLLNYKTKLVWTQFLFAIPMIIIFLFIMPIAILLPLFGLVFIWVVYKKHKYDLVKETIDYLKTRIFQQI